jgi:hypothetical protein
MTFSAANPIGLTKGHPLPAPKLAPADDADLTLIVNHLPTGAV